MKSTFAAATLLMAISTSASALIIAQDTFTYPDGDLVGNGSVADLGWAEAWRGDGNTDVSGGVVSGVSNTRVFRELSSPIPFGDAGTSVFIGFDHEIGGFYSAVEFRNLSDSDGDMNFRFGNLDQGLGLVDEPDTVGNFIAASPTASVMHRYVIEINYGAADADTATLYKDGTSLGTTSVPVDLAFDRVSFASFRAGPFGDADNLVIATTFAEANIPEPGSLALLGLGGLLIARRRRA